MNSSRSATNKRWFKFFTIPFDSVGYGENRETILRRHAEKCVRKGGLVSEDVIQYQARIESIVSRGKPPSTTTILPRLAHVQVKKTVGSWR